MDKQRWGELKDYEKIIYLEGQIYDIKMFSIITIFILIYFITKIWWFWIPMVVIMALLQTPAYAKGTDSRIMQEKGDKFNKKDYIKLFLGLLYIVIVLYLLSLLSDLL